MIHRTIVPAVLLAAVLCVAPFAAAQKSDKPQPAADPALGHLERPNDPYVRPPTSGRTTTPARRWSRDGYVSVQVNVDEFGNNIVGDAANEPSIAVDPANPARMVIGWRQFDSITSDFRQAGYGYTADGGQTWTFPGVIEPGIFRSDPVLDADADGNFYYNSLTAEGYDFWCHVYKSTDGGATWDAGTYAYGGDKQWQAIDTTDGIGRGNIYAFWTAYWSICYPDHFTVSYDNGASFEPCTSVAGSPQWGTLAVGPDGELYVCGDGFIVAKSTTIQDESQPEAWDFSRTVSLGGSMMMSAGPNPGGLLGQAWIAVDHSDGPTRGNVYLLCSVDPPGADPLDVMFSRSTDGGDTWSTPVRVNDDLSTSAWQWFGTMSVAPNGRIDVVWLDTRNALGGYNSVLYYSSSTDGGVTWSPNEALTPWFDPHVGWPQQNKMGDYFDMVSDEYGASLAYAATFNGEQDVYYVRIGDPYCPDDGRVSLDKPKCMCEDSAGITVVDCGLNTDDEAIETVVVAVDSNSETGEQVTLTETGPSSARFEGGISLSTTDGAGVLLVADGDTVTITYIDADDGQGGTNIVVTATATVDCAPPVVSNVTATSIGSASAIVNFDTDELARATVFYGEDCAVLDHEVAAEDFVTTHAVALEGLSQYTQYYYAVQAEDEAGNVTYDDAGGACYAFTTAHGPQPIHAFTLDIQPMGWSTEGNWAFGVPTGQSGSAGGPDPTSGHTGDNVFGYNLNGGYTNSMPRYHLTTTALNCSDAVETELKFYRWLGVESSNWDHAGVEVSNDGSQWVSLWEHDDVSFTDSEWTQYSYDISAVADNQPTVFIRWAMGTTDGSVTYCGWNIDDIEIWGVLPQTTPGDMNCDGLVNSFDIDPFVLAVSDQAAYEAQYPDCTYENADVNGDGLVNSFDIDPFVNLLTGG